MTQPQQPSDSPDPSLPDLPSEPLPTTRGGPMATGAVVGSPPPDPDGDGRTRRGGGAAPQRRRSTYVEGDRVALPGGGGLFVDAFMAASGEAELYRVEADPAALPPRVPLGAPVVLKVYHHGAEPNQAVLDLWAGMSSPGVLRMFDHGVLDTGRAFEVVELAVGGSLAQQLPIRDLDRLRGILASVASGLQALHEHDILHRDIKPDNLLCRDAEGRDVVLADFGVATVLAGRSLVISRAGFGTPEYMAPEQRTALSLDGAAKSVMARSVDYYALGITLLACYLGESPFGRDARTAAELLALKQHGRVPIPDELPESWKRLVRALLAVDPSQRLDHEGVQRWLRGEPIVVPETRSTVTYPPVVFRTERGQDVQVTDPTELASLLEANPTIGRRFLYGRYVERAGWEAVNLGLSAALTQIIEDLYPHDQAAGLTTAVYTLDPMRPYRGFDGSLHESYAGLAAHLLEHVAHYLPLLSSPTHQLWLYLASRPDPRVRTGLAAFVTEAGAAVGDAERRRAFHRLALWLRALDGERSLPFAGEAPAQPRDGLTRLPDAAKAQATKAILDPDSLLSVWLVETDPDLAPLLDCWRARCPGDERHLRCALAGGVEVAGVVLREPLDAFLGAPEVLRAVWDDDRPEDLERVEEYFATFRDVSLAAAALRLVEDDVPLAVRRPVLDYVVRSLPELTDLGAAAAPAAPATGWDDLRTCLISLLSPRSEVDQTAGVTRFVGLTRGEGWAIQAHLAASVVQGTAQLPPAEEHASDALLARTAKAMIAELERPTDRVPLLLGRLAMCVYVLTSMVKSSATRPTEERERRSWQVLARHLAADLTRLHRQGYEEIPEGAGDLRWLSEFMDLAHRDYSAMVPDQSFSERLLVEETAYAREARAIDAAVDAELTAGLARIDAEEKQALAAAVKAAAGGLRWRVGKARALLILVSVIGALMLFERIVGYFDAFTPTKTAITVLVAAATGFWAFRKGSFARPRLRLVAGALGGVLVCAVLAAILSLVTIIVLVVVAWRWAEYDTAKDALTAATTGVMLTPAQSVQFYKGRELVTGTMEGRRRAWSTAVRREIALADDPRRVEQAAVRARLAA